MKIFLVIQFQLLLINCDTIFSNFLVDFFMDKPCTITIHICWNYKNTYELLKSNLQSPTPKQISVHKDSKEHQTYLQHLSNNNYLVLDMNGCEQSWRILDKMNHSLEFRFPLKFLLLVDEEVFRERLVEKLSNYTIFPSTDLVIARKTFRHNVTLLQPYRIDNVAEIIWEDYGFWNATNLVEKIGNIPLSQRRRDLKRMKMEIGLYIEFNSTWNHLEDFKKPRIDTFTKQNYGTIKALMELCNIDFSIRPTKNWGYYNETTKQWSGLVDLVRSKQVLIAGSSPYFTKQRFTVVDFIKMQNRLEIRFVMKKPPLSNTYNIFSLPFSSGVWTALAVLILISMLAVHVIYNWESKTHHKFNLKGRFSLSDIFLIMLESVCQQGTMLEPQATPSRILIIFLFVSFMFLYCAYSAFIIVLLQSTHTVASYQELVDNNMMAGAMETSYMRVYVAGSKLKVQQDLYKKKIGPEGFYKLEDGLDRVQKGYFAFHCEVVASYDYIVGKFTDYDICNLQIMEGFNEYLKGYTMVPKNSAYKEIFKVGLMRIEEYGIQRRNYGRYVRYPKCNSGGGGSFQSVGLQESYNAILILASGCCLAVLVLLAELGLRKHKRRKIQETPKLFLQENLVRFGLHYK